MSLFSCYFENFSKYALTDLSDLGAGVPPHNVFHRIRYIICGCSKVVCVKGGTTTLSKMNHGLVRVIHRVEVDLQSRTRSITMSYSSS